MWGCRDLGYQKVYVTASLSELPYATAFAGLGRFLTHPRLLQVFGSIKVILSPTLQDNG